MSVVTVKDRARLRLGFEGSRGRTDPFGIDTQPPGRQKGVVIWGETRNQLIPPGAVVHVRVDRPDYLSSVHSDDTQPAAPVPGLAGSQGFLFESASQPAALTVGGAVQRRGRQRILHVAPGTPGRFQVNQQEPAWASRAPSPAPSDLVVLGKYAGQILMPGQAGDTPDLNPADTHLLRVRWTGTVEGGGPTLVALVGGETFVAGVWPNDHKRLVPGSIVITVPGPITVRDTGDGRLVGIAGGTLVDGTINYITGDWQLTFAGTAVGAGNVVATTYEHSCLYAPLDIDVEWDALMNQ
jgi:hypothetical protein